MKKLFIILAAAVAVASCEQSRCVIKGEITGTPDGMLYLAESSRNGAILDSTVMENGRFVFRVNDAEPQLLTIKSGDDFITNIYTESGKIKVSGDVALDKIVMEGTPGNEAASKFNAEIIRLRQRIDQAYDEAERNAIFKEYQDLIDTYIDANMDNIFGVSIFIHNKGYELSASEMLDRLNTLSPEMAALAIVDEAKIKYERKMRTEPRVEGSEIIPIYIDIVQPDKNGKEIALSEVVKNKKNRYVLLDFWASWCGPCMGEMPHLTAAYKKYHRKGFEIYGVSLDRSAERWNDAMKKVGMKWVNVAQLDGFNNAATEEYVVESIPTNFLIDCATGEIIAKNLRGEAVEERLAELLK